MLIRNAMLEMCIRDRGYIVAAVGDEAGEIPYTAYFAKKSYLAENADLVQRFTNAVYKGQQWVQEHTAREVAEAVQDSFADTDLEMCIRDSYEAVRHGAGPGYHLQPGGDF